MASPERGSSQCQTARSPNWLAALRAYLVASAVGHLAWETAQLPFYTIWSTATRGALAFAVAHCTGGDILIALTALVASLATAGASTWPAHRFASVSALTLGIGIGYAVFSEWWNVAVRGTWAYAASMPTLPWIGTGVSPLLQWAVVPTLALLASRSQAAHRNWIPDQRRMS